jgi:hypothetical protein
VKIKTTTCEVCGTEHIVGEDCPNYGFGEKHREDYRNFEEREIDDVLRWCQDGRGDTFRLVISTEAGRTKHLTLTREQVRVIRGIFAEGWMCCEMWLHDTVACGDTPGGVASDGTILCHKHLNSYQALLNLAREGEEDE